MLGIGTWKIKVSNMFYNGEVTLKVFDNNGEYGFELIEPKMSAPTVEIKQMSTSGNHLSAVFTARELRGRDATIDLDFTQDTVSGKAKLPLVGTVKITDGIKLD